MAIEEKTLAQALMELDALIAEAPEQARECNTAGEFTAAWHILSAAKLLTEIRPTLQNAAELQGFQQATGSGMAAMMRELNQNKGK